MATFKEVVGKKGRISYEFAVAKKHVRKSKTFKTLTAGWEWAKEQEVDIINKRTRKIVPASVRQLLQKYIDEAAHRRKGGRAETLRCRKFMRTLPFVNQQADDITTADIGAWRNAMLDGTLVDRQPDGSKVKRAPIKPNSAHREMGTLRRVFELGRKEWMHNRANPFVGVETPTRGPARKRRISAEEISLVVWGLWPDYKPGATPRIAKHRTAIMFMFAIETGMRAGEILSLTSGTVDYRAEEAHLAKTKNGDARDVPLNAEAMRLLKTLPLGAPTLFNVDAPTRDKIFRDGVKASGVKNLHFHDTRHEAITRMVQDGLDVATVGKSVGTRNLNQLMTYYNPTSKEINAMRLAARQPSPHAPQPQRQRPTLRVVPRAA